MSRDTSGYSDSPEPTGDIIEEPLDTTEDQEQYQHQEQGLEELDWQPAAQAEHYSATESLEMLKDANLEKLSQEQNMLDDPGLHQGLQQQMESIKQMTHSAT